MTTNPTITLEDIDSALEKASPNLPLDARRVAVAVYRLLATAQPVPLDRAAASAGISVADAEPIVHAWPSVFRDEQDRIVGFGGLALETMAHRLRIAGRDLSAWCAWDPFFLAQIIGDMRVATHDPITHDEITYQIGADAVINDLSHPDSVLSFLRPDQPWDDNVMATFCHFVNQFADSASAERWTADHPGTFVLSLGDAIELAHRHVARTFEPAVSARS